MIYNNYAQDRFRRRGYAGFAGAWEDWCDTKYAADPGNLSKCKGWSPFAPWTDAGALMRGIPKSGSLIVSMLQPTPASLPTTSMPPVSTEAMGTSKTMLMIGGGLLALGVGVVLFKR
jgi:hypothetical protein